MVDEADHLGERSRRPAARRAVLALAGAVVVTLLAQARAPSSSVTELPHDTASLAASLAPATRVESDSQPAISAPPITAASLPMSPPLAIKASASQADGDLPTVGAVKPRILLETVETVVETTAEADAMVVHAVTPTRSRGELSQVPIIQVGCASCGSGVSFAGPDLYAAARAGAWGDAGPGSGLYASPEGNCTDSVCVGVDSGGCCVSNCYPLRPPCYDSCEEGNIVTRAIGLMYEVLCCPDPFYELTGPHWVPAANAAMFVEGAQPRSQTRLRWDAGQNVALPDRNEFFFAQANGSGLGPNPLLGAAQQQGNNGGAVPAPQGIGSVNYDDLCLYIETAIKNGKFSAFVNTKYRSVDPTVVSRDAGFGDMDIGTKSLLLDRELIQLTFQFRTYFPTGIAFDGTGNGHVTIEPSVLFNVKLYQDLYWQGQILEWIPFGGLYAAGILNTNQSVNKVLWRLNPDVCLVGTAEFSAWWMQGGYFTDPATLLPVPSSSGRYYSMGPGLRLCFRNMFDFGFGSSFSLSRNHWAEQLYRLEARFMY